MKAETIREWLTRRPLGKNRIAVVDPATDRFVHIALIHINSIQALQAA